MNPNPLAALLAKDVLGYLANGKFIATQGDFFHMDPTTCRSNVLLKTAMEKSSHCRVCADGALFAAKVLRYNGLKLSEMNIGNFFIKANFKLIRTTMKGYVSEKQLQLIEVAFERGRGYFGHPVDLDCNIVANLLTNDEFGKAKSFGEQYHNPQLRLSAIMQNMVDNQGNFIP